jgi:creatinine deaminase
MDKYMKEAVAEAMRGRAQGGIPVGSVIVYKGKIIGRGYNQRIQKGSVILHGEMDALENAGRQPAEVYRECVLYTTLSPCSMCSGAIILYGIKKVVIGENVSFKGPEDLLMANSVKLQVLNDPVCIGMMKDFIREYPSIWHEDIGK